MQTWKIPSSKGQLEYEVSLADGRWECTCPGYFYHDTCRHIEKCQVETGELKGSRIDERLVQISRARAPVEGDFKMGEDVRILVRGTIEKIELEDNNNGSYTKIYKVKPTIIQDLNSITNGPTE